MKIKKSIHRNILLIWKKTPIIKKLRFDKYLFLLTILSVVFLVSVVRYGLRTFKIPEWDEQHYMRMATEFYRLIKYNLSPNTLHEMLQVVPFRQIGYPLLIVPFLFAFGLSNSYFWGIFTNGLLYIVSIFGIYFLARNFVSKLASFMAAFIFAFYGWTLLHVHLTYSETATSAFCILIILFLIKSNYFQSRKYSILFGLSLGLGLLIKWIVIVYVFGPLLYVLYQILKRRLFTKKRVLLHATLSFLIAFLVSFYPYYQNFYWIIEYFRGHRVGGPMWQIVSGEERNPLSAYSLTFYLNSFAQLGIVQFLIFIAGFILAFRKKSKLKPILLAVIISYAFSCYALLKAERHIIPNFPYLAILSASVFYAIKTIRYKTILIALTIIISILTFLGSVWGKGPMKQSLYTLPVKLPFGQLDKIYLTSISRPPYIYKISGREILDFIAKDSKSNRIADPQILSLFYYRPLDEPLMTYNLYNQEKPLTINNFVGTVINDPDKEGVILIDNVLKSDYILTKSGQKTDNYFAEINYKTLKAIIIFFDNYLDIKNYYEERAKIWINQDSSEVTVFKKKKEVKQEELKKMELKFVEILKEVGK
ncbi:MAG: glycosyltransferase family 39 protein [Patescibacteria group bacterium]